MCMPTGDLCPVPQPTVLPIGAVSTCTAVVQYVQVSRIAFGVTLYAAPDKLVCIEYLDMMRDAQLHIISGNATQLVRNVTARDVNVNAPAIFVTAAPILGAVYLANISNYGDVNTLVYAEDYMGHNLTLTSIAANGSSVRIVDCINTYVASVSRPRNFTFCGSNSVVQNVTDAEALWIGKAPAETAQIANLHSCQRGVSHTRFANISLRQSPCNATTTRAVIATKPNSNVSIAYLDACYPQVSTPLTRTCRVVVPITAPNGSAVQTLVSCPATHVLSDDCHSCDDCSASNVVRVTDSTCLGAAALQNTDSLSAILALAVAQVGRLTWAMSVAMAGFVISVLLINFFCTRWAIRKLFAYARVAEVRKKRE